MGDQTGVSAEPLVCSLTESIGPAAIGAKGKSARPASLARGLPSLGPKLGKTAIMGCLLNPKAIKRFKGNAASTQDWPRLLLPSSARDLSEANRLKNRRAKFMTPRMVMMPIYLVAVGAAYLRLSLRIRSWCAA